jgi:hypothetical protein
MRIYDIFYINLLTPYCKTLSYGTNYIRPPSVTEDSEEECEIENIQDI